MSARCSRADDLPGLMRNGTILESYPDYGSMIAVRCSETVCNAAAKAALDFKAAEKRYPLLADAWPDEPIC
jgi:hypothetical protein